MKDEFVQKIEEYTSIARGIAWDTCHKIYILLDDEQMRLMKDYGYDPLISHWEMNSADMAAKVMEWYEDSCGLRFVSAVETNREDPNDGFITIIGQFADEEETCRQCGAEDEDVDEYEGMCYDCWHEGQALINGDSGEDEDSD
jgi:hypothetical protein